jgi:hypothetical protein
VSELIEKEFAALLARGWPGPPKAPEPTIGGLILLCACHESRMAQQLINSAVPETRDFWRARYPALALAEGKEGQ